MCCESGHHYSGDYHGHHHFRHHGDFCKCGESFHYTAGFLSKEEKIAWLEQYREKIAGELKTVEERVAALKEES